MVNPLQTNNRTGTKYGGVSATSVPSHNVLSDLTTGDDHPQYVRTDGTRVGWPVPATPITDHGALTGLTDNDHVLYLDIEDYQQTTGANPDQCYIANCRTGVALATLTLTANRTYWIPFVAPARGGTLEDVRLQITTAAAGQNIRIALYNCVSDGSGKPLTSDFRPSGSAIVSATQSTASTGTFVFSFARALTAGRLYWYCLMSSGAPAIRAVSTNETDMGLGWQIPSGTTTPNAITYWYETITYSSGLPTKAGNETYTNGTGSAPAIFHTWSA
jgi:hypothetical protein